MERGILFPKSKHSHESVRDSTKVNSFGEVIRSEFWDGKDGRTVSSSEAKRLDVLMSKLLL